MVFFNCKMFKKNGFVDWFNGLVYDFIECLLDFLGYFYGWQLMETRVFVCHH